MFSYTIIIPHKNCPDLLKRCVDSIPVRDDVQIIVVDDNSDEDKKPSIERKGVEVVLLDAESSKGAGRARNVGLKRAKGKWLLFADADDYYTDKLSNFLDKYADDDTTDVVYLNANVFNEKGDVRPHSVSKLIEDYRRNLPNAELRLRYSTWTPWTRMVKREMVDGHHITFDELPATNDKMFSLYCSYHARTIATESDVLYMYFKSVRGSQTDKKRNHLMLDGLLDVRVRTLELYKKAGYKPLPSFYELVYNPHFYSGLHAEELDRKYKQCLERANVSRLQDLCRYYRKKLRNLSATIRVSLSKSGK